MLPLTKPSSPHFPVFEIPSVSNSANEKKILLPLIELSPDGSFICNYKQDPVLISEENYENDLQQSLRSVIEKRNPLLKTSLLDFKKRYSAAYKCLYEINGLNINLTQLVIPTFEELIWRDDIDFKADLNDDTVHEDFFNLDQLNKLDFVINHDHEAYLAFLLYVFCLLTWDNQHTKFLNAIKAHLKNSDPHFEDHFFLKKMAFLGLTRTMDKQILVKMLGRDIEKYPENAPSLINILQYMEQKILREHRLVAPFGAMLRAIENQEYKNLMKHLQEALDAQGHISEYRRFIKTFSNALIYLNKKQLVLDMCDMTLAMFPGDKCILRIRESVNNQKSITTALITEMQTLGINPDGTDVETKTSTVSVNNGKIYDLTAQKELRSLVEFDQVKGFSWDFNQNDWLLDRDTWGIKLMEEFLVNLQKQYPDVRPDSVYKEDDKRIEKVTIFADGQIDISTTSYASLLPIEKGKINVVELLNRLFLKKMWIPLNHCLNDILKPSNKKFFSPSQELYVGYVCLIVALYQKDQKKMETILLYFEIGSNRSDNPVAKPFLEKLKTLIYASYCNGNCKEDPPAIAIKSIDYLDGCLKKIHKTRNSSLLLLKAEFLIDAKQYKECRLLLESLPAQDKIKPEYFKVLCNLEFNVGTWQKAIKVGEKYLELCNRDDLNCEDLSVAHALSTIYRFNATIGNGELVKRLINSLKNSKNNIYLERFLRHFFSIIFNIYVNPYANEFSTHQIPFIDGESPRMRSAKEVALYYINQKSPVINFPKKNQDVDVRLSVLSEDATIANREEVGYMAEVCLAVGCDHYIKKDYAKALVHFETVDRMVRHHMDGLRYRVKALLNLEEFAKAYHLLKTCCEKSFIQTDWYELHALCLIGLNKSEEALEVVQKELKENPTIKHLILLEIKLLTQFERNSKLVERAREALKLDLSRSERLDILRNVLEFLETDPDPNYLDTQFLYVLNNSADNIDLEAFFLMTMHHIWRSNIPRAKELLASYKQDNYIRFFLQASIEIEDEQNEKALVSLSKSLELRPKIKEKDIYNSVNFYFLK